MFRLLRQRAVFERLNRMIDEAANGTFEESCYDETELSRLEMKWKRFLSMSKLSHQRVEEERQEIKELVSDISHQVKAPLSNILLYTQLLQESAEDEDLKALAGEIGRQSEKLNFLLASLVKVSRLETGVFKMEAKRQDIMPMLAKAREGLLAKAEKKSIAILLENPGQETEADFDAKWTEEALENILDNAVKYSPEHTAVTISVKDYEMFACIIIKDEGMGISEEEIPKIFGRFYRGAKVQQEEGVGIGLYLARQIIENQRGYIKVSSAQGEGTEFFVYLRKSLMNRLSS